METTHLRTELTVSVEEGRLVPHVTEALDDTAKVWDGFGATTWSVTGHWDGTLERGVRIQFDWPKADSNLPSIVATLVRKLAQHVPNARLVHGTPYEVGFREIDLDLYRDQVSPSTNTYVPSFDRPWGPNLKG